MARPGWRAARRGRGATRQPHRGDIGRGGARCVHRRITCSAPKMGEAPGIPEPLRQLICKPDSVVSSHPSQRPTWTLAGNLQTVLLGLASGGVCLAAASPRRRCALTAPFQPCRAAPKSGRRRCVFCGTFPRVSPGRRYRPPCPSMSGLSSRADGSRDCPIRQVKVAGRKGMVTRPARYRPGCTRD